MSLLTLSLFKTPGGIFRIAFSYKLDMPTAPVIVVGLTMVFLFCCWSDPLHKNQDKNNGASFHQQQRSRYQEATLMEQMGILTLFCRELHSSAEEQRTI
jgi:hypothetical protein